MGLNLRILPQFIKNANIAHDIIEFGEDSKLFEKIIKLEDKKGRDVPRKGIHSFSGSDENFEGHCYGKTIETPYGEIMKSVLVSELNKVLADYKTEGWRNKAVIAFLSELPNDLEIWLYWH